MARKKKAWNMSNPLYRYLHGGTRKSKTKNRSVATMAKRRKARGFSRGRGKGVSLTGAIIGGGVYGAARGYLSNLVKPLTDKMPMGNIADNLVLGGIAYFVAKKSGNKTLKDIGRAGLYIEAAMAGQDLLAGGLNIGGTTGSW